jgi:stage III sporulation protein AB
MSIKLIGAVLVLLVCGGTGFKMAANHRREVKSLQQLCAALEHMECEMLYRLTPLPELCRRTAEASTGAVAQFFFALSQELESQIAPEVFSCIQAALWKVKYIPTHTCKILERFGASLGSFDMEGQLKGLAAAREDAKQSLALLTDNQDARLRSYQTLGLCAGAAVVILFI